MFNHTLQIPESNFNKVELGDGLKRTRSRSFGNLEFGIPYTSTLEIGAEESCPYQDATQAKTQSEIETNIQNLLDRRDLTIDDDLTPMNINYQADY